MSNEGDELALSQKSRQKGKTTPKKEIYAQIGVRYYVVFDPLKQIQGADQMNGALLRVWSISPDGYPEFTPSEGIREVGQSIWLPTVGIGLTLWEGQFEEAVTQLWLRWCVYPSGGTASQRDGQLIPTGAEGRDIERQRADRLAERLQALGINPDEV